MSWLSSALRQNWITLAQLTLLRMATSQNRDAENRGCNTIVPPVQNVESIEYDIAFVWNSGSCSSVVDWRPRPRCDALTFPAHTQFACVQTTAFGREVVPEVYEIGSPVGVS